MTDSAEYQYLNIKATEKGLFEMQGVVPTVRLRKEDIVRAELRFGVRAERPILQLMISVVLIVLGIVLPLQSLYNWLFNEGVFYIDVQTGLFFLAPLGGWLLWESSHKGYSLLVTTRGDRRKLVFRGKVSEAELRCFLCQIGGLKYEVIDNSGRLS